MAKRKRLGPSGGNRRPGGAGDRSDPRSRTAPVRLYGLHPVRAALSNPARRLRHLWLSGNAARALAPEIAALGARAPAVETDPRAALDRLLPAGAVHQGAVLEADPLDPPGLDALLPDADAPALIVLLDQITDPQNAGAIMRSAAAFGATGMVLTLRHAPMESGALAKAAAGALDRLPIARVANLSRAIEALQAAGFWVAGLDGGAEATLDGVDPPPRLALVLGAEGKGLRRKTAETCDQLIAIPMAARIAGGAAGPAAIDSLNVSNAAAIALYALSRHLG